VECILLLLCMEKYLHEDYRIVLVLYLSSVLFSRLFVFRELLLYTVRELFKKKDTTTKLPNPFVALLVVPPLHFRASFTLIIPLLLGVLSLMGLL